MHNGKIFLEIEQISKKLLFLKENIPQKSENYVFSFDLLSKLISKKIPNKNNQTEILTQKLEDIHRLNHEKNINLKEELNIKIESRSIRLENIEKSEKQYEPVQDDSFTSIFEDFERNLERKKNEILDLHRDLSKIIILFCIKFLMIVDLKLEQEETVREKEQLCKFCNIKPLKKHNQLYFRQCTNCFCKKFFYINLFILKDFYHIRCNERKAIKKKDETLNLMCVDCLELVQGQNKY